MPGEIPSRQPESHVTAPTNPHRWDIGEISAALQAEPGLTSDVAHGIGTSWRLGTEQREQTELAVFPDAGVVRVTSEAEGVQVTIFRQHQGPTIEPGGSVVFELPSKPERRFLAIGANGAATLAWEPAQRPEIASPGGEPATRPGIPLTHLSRPEDHLRAAQHAATETVDSGPRQPIKADAAPAGSPWHEATAPPAVAVRAEQPRRGRVEGTIVYAPVFKVTSAKQKEVTIFLVAEHYTDQDGKEQTVYHRCAAFNNEQKRLADTVRDEAQQGDKIVVHGNWHDVPITYRNGSTKIERQLWAYGLKITPKASSSQQP